MKTFSLTIDNDDLEDSRIEQLIIDACDRFGLDIRGCCLDDFNGHANELRQQLSTVKDKLCKATA
jgi:hypothetical protein